MPTAKIYTADNVLIESLSSALHELRDFLARELTCGDIALKPNEVSIRIVSVADSLMIAPVEIEITAHAFADRVKQADKICLSVRQFVKDKLALPEDVRVWLVLSDLGHSWEE